MRIARHVKAVDLAVVRIVRDVRVVVPVVVRIGRDAEVEGQEEVQRFLVIVVRFAVFQ